MTDREFAIIIRRMLLAIVAKMEQRYSLGKYAEARIVEVQQSDNITAI